MIKSNMLAHTHIMFTIFSILLVNRFIEIPNLIFFAVIAMFFTLFVDIDKASSVFGQEVWPISLFVEKFVGHRKLFHSLVIPALLFIFLSSKGLTVYGIAVVTGYLSHLTMDTITSSGINPLWPIPIRISGPIKTGSIMEHLVFIFIVFGALVVLFY
jgi:inner membrane protein